MLPMVTPFRHYLGQPQDLFLTEQLTDEILWSLPVSIVLAIVWMFANTKKWISRFLQKIGATNKNGDEDVWDFTFSSPGAAVEYVHVRDFDKNITYCGWVDTYSETGKLRELVLRDEIIYDSEGKQAEVPLLYLARAPSDIHIEFPFKK